MKIRLLAVAVIVLGASGVFAADMGMDSATANLQPGFATSLADTTPTPVGKFSVGVAGSYATNGTDVEAAVIQVAYGLTSEMQATASWPMLLGQGRVAGNGDTVLALLWAPVKEDGNMPSMGLEVSGSFPTGYGFTGYNGTITGVATKTLGEIRAHLNASFTTIGKPQGGENHVDNYVLGMDYMILDNMCLVVDGYSAQNPVKFQDRIEMVEVGLRVALTDMDIVSVGVAVGVGNGNMTPDLMGTVGYQREL